MGIAFLARPLTPLSTRKAFLLRKTAVEELFAEKIPRSR
jgi:hypothetical protein